MSGFRKVHSAAYGDDELCFIHGKTSVVGYLFRVSDGFPCWTSLL
jgi:hypothetical protein